MPQDSIIRYLIANFIPEQLLDAPFGMHHNTKEPKFQFNLLCGQLTSVYLQKQLFPKNSFYFYNKSEVYTK